MSATGHPRAGRRAHLSSPFSVVRRLWHHSRHDRIIICVYLKKARIYLRHCALHSWQEATAVIHSVSHRPAWKGKNRKSREKKYLQTGRKICIYLFIFLNLHLARAFRCLVDIFRSAWTSLLFIAGSLWLETGESGEKDPGFSCHPQRYLTGIKECVPTRSTSAPSVLQRIPVMQNNNSDK